MKKTLLIFTLIICSMVVYGQNTFKYEIKANGGLRVGGATNTLIDSITTQGGKMRIMSGAALQEIYGHILVGDTATMLLPYILDSEARTAINDSLNSLNHIKFAGSTSGTTRVQAPAVAGTTTITLPSATGTLATLDNINDSIMFYMPLTTLETYGHRRFHNDILEIYVWDVDGDGELEELAAAVVAARTASASFNYIEVASGNYSLTAPIIFTYENQYTEVRGRNTRLWIPAGSTINAIELQPLGGINDLKINGLTFREVHEGRQYNWNGIYVDLSSGGYVMYCDFRDLAFRSVGNVFLIPIYNGGYFNANNISNLDILTFRKFLKVDRDVTNVQPWFNGNIFNNIQAQMTDGVTTHFVDTLYGNSNQFIACQLHDPKNTMVAYHWARYSNSNSIIGGKIGNAQFIDESRYSNIWLHGTNDNNSNLRIGGYYDILSNVGNMYGYPIFLESSETTGSGAGIGFSTDGAAYYNNVGASIVFNRTDIRSKGELQFYTKQTTSNMAAPTKAMVITDAGGVVYSTKSTGSVPDSLAASKLGRVIYYNESGASDLTYNPQIVAGQDGQIITIVGSSDTNTLTLDDGDGLALSAQCVLGLADTITLVYIASLDLWCEISRSNN